MRSHWLVALVVVGIAAACGKSGEPQAVPSTPSSLPQSSPPSPPPVTFSGVVTATNDNRPLVAVDVGIGTMTTTTDSNGRFSIALTGETAPNVPYVVSGTNLLPHAGALKVGASRTVNLDAVVQDGSFDLTFYRALVRGGSVNSPLRRWTTNPNVYIKTIDSSTGLAVEPEVLALVADWAKRSVSMWSGGQLQVGTVESGPSDLRGANGWIVVNFLRDLSRNICATGASIAANPGVVTLNIGRCGCGSTKVPPGIVLHEIGHVLGFYDLTDPRSVMYPVIPGGCPTPSLSAAEQRHAAIAYRRANGNIDPDIDPDGAPLIGRALRVP